MRFLFASLLVAFTIPVLAEEKDEEKAKAVVGEFLKAVADRKIDAVMKTVDTPFVLGMGSPKPKRLEKSAELKEAITRILDQADLDKVKSLKVGKVYDMAGIAKYIKDNPKGVLKGGEEFPELAEKLVGKTGYMVMIEVEGMEVTGYLIRIKDGKAFIASVSR